MRFEDVPIITFAARSGTGKTSFLEQVIPILKQRGIRLALIKHDAHRFEMDKPGKDTWRFTQAGADIVCIANQEKFAMLEQTQGGLSLREVVERLPQADLILTEGYKKNPVPKIEVHRAELGRPLLSSPEELIAVVTDEPLNAGVPEFPLNDPVPCAEFIEEYMNTFYRTHPKQKQEK